MTLGLASVFVVARATVVLNMEPSVARGIWGLHPVPAVLTHGTVVVYPPPLAAWPFHPWWLRFVKPVAAVAGEVVCVRDGALWIRGESYGAVVETVGGRAIPHLHGCLTVGEGEVFVASKHLRSHDSRYYGPVQVGTITHTVTPWWVQE